MLNYTGITPYLVVIHKRSHHVDNRLVSFSLFPKYTFVMIKGKLVKLFQSKTFKITSIVLGIIFITLTIVIAFDPQPFLKFGYLGVFIFSLFGSGTLLILPLAGQMNLFGLAFTSALGMAINDSVGWLVGRNGESLIPHSKKVEAFEKSIKRFGVVALFFWALIPGPYEIIGVIAGYLAFPFKGFVAATFLGRFVRFILIGTGILAISGKIWGID